MSKKKQGDSSFGKITGAILETEDGKEATQNLAKTAVMVTSATNNCLSLIGNSFTKGREKTREYFQKKFPKEISEKTKDIPDQDIIEPKASVAGPAMQGLAYSHEEPNLKEMYTSLLANSMNSKRADIVHPSFVEIIKQMTSEEAQEFSEIVKDGTHHPICSIYLDAETGGGSFLLKEHLIRRSEEFFGKQLALPKNFEAMISNYIRLGLVEVNYGVDLTAPGQYNWIETSPDYLETKSARTPDEQKRIGVTRGFMRLTKYGENFSEAVELK